MAGRSSSSGSPKRKTSRARKAANKNHQALNGSNKVCRNGVKMKYSIKSINNKGIVCLNYYKLIRWFLYCLPISKKQFDFRPFSILVEIGNKHRKI